MDWNELMNYTQVILWFVGSFVPFLGLWIWIYKRNKKLHQNLKRPIYLYEMQKDNLERVRDILAETELNPQDTKTDIKFLDSLNGKSSVCIVGYYHTSTSDKQIKDIIDKLQNKKIPLIVYAPKSQIIDSNTYFVIQNYSYSEICNSPLRLVTLINSICQTFPYEKR